MSWDKKEIEEYKQLVNEEIKKKEIKRERMESFYNKAHLPESCPEARMKYIVDLFNPNSTLFTYPSRIYIDKLGKVKTLKSIEERIAERFF